MKEENGRKKKRMKEGVKQARMERDRKEERGVMEGWKVKG